MRTLVSIISIFLLMSEKILQIHGLFLSPMHRRVSLKPNQKRTQNLGRYGGVKIAATSTGENNIDGTLGEPKRVSKGSVPEFAIEGDSTEETPVQRAVVATHFALATFNMMLASTVMTLQTPVEWLSLASTVALSVVLGDFGTGVFHWSVDNYGSLKTPVFGSVCAAFQGHHVTPWTITFRSFANNVYKICFATVPALAILAVSGAGPLTRIFFTLFITWWMISQELHKYSHMRQTPAFVKNLQDWGIILSKKEHGLHHTSPFEGHYCILTGVCNPILDKTNFFRYLEHIVYKLTGNKPNTWQLDPELETLSGRLVGARSE